MCRKGWCRSWRVADTVGVGGRGRWLPALLVVGVGVTAVEVAVLVAAGFGSWARWADWPNAWWVVLPALPIGWSFVAVGLFTWRRRPDNRVGPLMTAVGFGQFASALWMVPVSLVYTVGLVVATWFVGVLAHLLLTFPSGRLSGRADRVLVVAGYLAASACNLVSMFFADDTDGGPPGVRNLLLVRADDGLAALLGLVTGVLLVGLLAVTAVVLLYRWRWGTTAQRQALSPVLPVGASYVILAGLRLAFPGEVGLLGPLIALVAIPYVFLAGLMRIQFFQMRALGSLMTGLGDRSYTGDLPSTLAAALDDVRVRVVYWLPDQDRYTDHAGRSVDLPSDGSGQAVFPIERDGQRMGAVIVDDVVVAEESQLVTGLIGAVELAMDNQRLEAELRARVLELERSRADVIRVGEAQRRQLERDLHDGAQQQLVALRLRLGLIRQSLARSAGAGRGGVLPSDVGVQVDTAMDDLDAALAGLRELAHGLHPMLLSTRGLAVAVESLAARAPVPVHVEVRVHGRLPEATESAAYFVIAESLTNIAKHAAATGATVTVREQSGRLLVEVRDDGVGGADPTGAGLVGLAARVAGLDGHLRIGASAQGGTVVQARIPLPADRAEG